MDSILMGILGERTGSPFKNAPGFARKRNKMIRLKL